MVKTRPFQRLLVTSKWINRSQLDSPGEFVSGRELILPAVEVQDEGVAWEDFNIAWYLKHLQNGCFNWMNQILYHGKMGVSPNIRLNLVALDVVQTPACFRDYVATTRRTSRYDMTSHDLAQKTLQQMGVSENSGFSPQIIHFNRVFHYKPSILGAHPYFLETPTCTSSYRRKP